MADPYGSAAPSTPLDSDELSTFFNQFLQTTSSSVPSSSGVRLRAQYHPVFPPPPHDTKFAAVSEADPDRFGGSVGRSDEMILVRDGNSVNSVSVADLSSSSGFDISDPGVCIRPGVQDGPENTLSSDDYLSCDREKRSDASGIPFDTVRSRNSSKRSRAAEVHNMSEKRRRSRINERMKALQKLIPNSNKTDKASMLDEAIEYLKELQLQVQMLTMRNGMNLYPVCFPGLLNPSQTGFNGGSGLLNTNRAADTFPANVETSGQSSLNFSNQYIDSNQQISLPMVSNLAIASVSPFGFEPSPHASYGSFNITAPSDGICKDDRTQTQIDPSQSGNNSSGIS